MIMTHFLMEIYCSYDKKKGKKRPVYCSGKKCQGFHCFENNCSFLSYTYCPNEIGYSDEMGIVDIKYSSVGFGGDMDADVDNSKYDEQRERLLKQWEHICKDKISEALDEYMNKRDEVLNINM